ncbi:Alpha/Beta hydrolase protein [Tricharina praecox]|uniref:Alpha/Beta hydrolase protein n=1 Tax=Tricharina praecox TaxID=43433 RepID=UPI0022207154|nr:Alpha/Beta hydrolase protein [Tricharina praecox]KAI5858412.1 Alpha/Beta hydrolase protein [Tricharina praecox]
MPNHKRQHSSHSRSHSHTHTPQNSTTLNLHIPSLHDAIPIETSLTVPTVLPSSRRIAIIAHPYGPLGGTCHDPVVQHICAVLVAHGFITSIFNFRGCGHSKGRTSWTGKAETGDYAAVAAWTLDFAAELRNGAPDGVELVLAGYSYGALVAAQCPGCDELVQAATSPPNEAFRKALTAGKRSARGWYRSHSEVGRTSYSGVRSPPLLPPQRSSISESDLRPPLSALVAAPLEPQVDLAALQIVTRYLLISPPLPPISSCLLPSFGFAPAVESVADPPTAAKRKGKGTKILVAWGDDDVFTGVKKYRRWGEKMLVALGEGFESVEVEGAGHFWGEGRLEVVERKMEGWLAGGNGRA